MIGEIGKEKTFGEGAGWGEYKRREVSKINNKDVWKSHKESYN